MKNLKTKLVNNTSNSPKCAENTCAATTAAPAMQALTEEAKKRLSLWKKGLSLAMQGNLWYKHVKDTCGVTSDPDIREVISFDVLTASTHSSSHMRSLGYSKVEGKVYRTILRTFLKLMETNHSGDGDGWYAIQYNRIVSLS